MKRIDPLAYLARNDKWYLGGGNRLLWAPQFPVWLDHPGFWDKAHYYNFEIEPVFTWTLLDEHGSAIDLKCVSRTWDPSKLVTNFRSAGLKIDEVKCCLPNDVLSAVIRIKTKGRKQRRLHLVAWTIQPSHPSRETSWVTDLEEGKGVVSFERHQRPSAAEPYTFACAFGTNRPLHSFEAMLSEGSTIQPHWDLTPFAAGISEGGLSDSVEISGITRDGLIYMALDTILDLLPARAHEVGLFFSTAPTCVEARSSIAYATRQNDCVAVSEQNWRDYFSTMPCFTSPDEYLQRYYWYRWYGLRLLTLSGGEGNYPHPAVCEGIGYFRAPISYSAPCHILENRWRHDPDLASGSLLTFLHNQRADGGFRGYIDVNRYRQEMFYHGNWGSALAELDALHPRTAFLAEVYDGLARYADYFDRERDAEGSGLYDIDNHYETGQEYMHRYLAVDPGADRDNWGEVFRLKGIDVTVYIYLLKQALAAASLRLGRKEHETVRWNDGAEKIRGAILGSMWDAREEMFFDVDPSTGVRTGVKAAVCFYPYMTDIVSAHHLPGLKRHLFNPAEFLTPFPVPSSSVDDPYFSADGLWKGKRMNCPWNGRVWPMTNSHMVEAIGASAIRFHDDDLRKHTGELITAFLRMMFFDGDARRPNCFEHYHPLYGTPSIYRGVDDYQHSWVVDLILKYVAGIRVSGNVIVIDPFPVGEMKFGVEDVFVRGGRLKVAANGRTVTAWWDGKRHGPATLGRETIEIPLTGSRSSK